MPTGIAIQNARLFDAAERVLLREGPHALTSRAVTSEAGCAKGVIHRHFDDFDAFLVALIEDRATRIEAQAAALRAAAGTGHVADNLAAAMCELFESVAVAMVGLVVSRDAMRARLRQRRPAGLPLLTEATQSVADYLAAERESGRIAADADIDTLAPTLIGAAHLLFADRSGPPPEPATVRKTVAAVIAPAVRLARSEGAQRVARARGCPLRHFPTEVDTGAWRILVRPGVDARPGSTAPVGTRRSERPWFPRHTAVSRPGGQLG